jgi:hypothetical protein
MYTGSAAGHQAFLQGERAASHAPRRFKVPVVIRPIQRPQPRLNTRPAACASLTFRLRRYAGQSQRSGASPAPASRMPRQANGNAEDTTHEHCDPRHPHLDKQPPHPTHDAMQAKPHEDGRAAKRRRRKKPSTTIPPGACRNATTDTPLTHPFHPGA